MNSYQQVIQMFQPPFRFLTFPCTTKPPQLKIHLFLSLPPPTILCSSLNDGSFSTSKSTQAHSFFHFHFDFQNPIYFILFLFISVLDNVIVFLLQFGYSPPEDLFGLEVEFKPRSQFYISDHF